MKRSIIQAFSLIVLCLINISVGCYPKVDKKSNLEATIIGENGQFDVYQDCENDCPYTSFDSGLSNYYGNIAIPQGKINVQPYILGPGHIRNPPSSDFNSVAGDNGKLINYNKVTAYPSYSGYNNPYKPYSSGDYFEWNHEGDGGWSPHNKGKQYQSDDYYTRVGPNDYPVPELPAEGTPDDSTNLLIGPKKSKKNKKHDLNRIFDKLFNKLGGSKLQAKPETNPSIGEKVDEYDGWDRPLCPQCKPYRDSYTHPKSKGVLRQIYGMGLG